MKTNYTTMAILAMSLFSQIAAAKLGANHSIMQLESNMQINVEAEIINNINEMLANVQASSIKTDVAKQLNISTDQSQTHELVQDVNKKLPEFKFKVVTTD